MMRKRAVTLSLVLLLIPAASQGQARAQGQAPLESLNPVIQTILGEVSEERIAATLHKLESFETRYVLSETDSPTRGIGAARRWIHQELESYSPRLQVTDHEFHVKKMARLARDVDLANIVAVLPGTTDPDRYILISAHYDSVNVKRKPRKPDAERIAELMEKGMLEDEARRYVELFPAKDTTPAIDAEATAAETEAPGVTDDGSGIAAMLELARVMSHYEFEKSLVFVAFAGEEVGLQGSKVYAKDAADTGMQIEAVLNNDIIGSTESGGTTEFAKGRIDNQTLRVFSNGPEDSPGRALLRYTKLIAERYVPSMRVDMIFHRDRFGRGGDHTSFQNRGFAAVRLTTARENYSHQHSPSDTFENTDPGFIMRVARMNAAVAASLALAPAPPVTNYTIQSGERKGNRSPLLSRGGGYDAVLRWVPSQVSKEDAAEAGNDLAGYAVVIRKTTAPDWEREIFVGNVTRYTIPDFSIDDVVLGVKAIDKDGNQSLVSAYLEPVSRERGDVPPGPEEEQPEQSAGSAQ